METVKDTSHQQETGVPTKRVLTWGEVAAMDEASSDLYNMTEKELMENGTEKQKEALKMYDLKR